MGHDHSLQGFKVKVIYQGQCKNVCATWVSTAASYEHWLTAVIVVFYCHVISYAPARRAVRRGTAETSGSDSVHRVWAR